MTFPSSPILRTKKYTTKPPKNALRTRNHLPVVTHPGKHLQPVRKCPLIIAQGRASVEPVSNHHGWSEAHLTVRPANANTISAWWMPHQMMRIHIHATGTHIAIRDEERCVATQKIPILRMVSCAWNSCPVHRVLRTDALIWLGRKVGSAAQVDGENSDNAPTTNSPGAF